MKKRHDLMQQLSRVSNEADRQSILANYFEGRKTAAFCTSEFWVFCKSEADKRAVKSQAKALGFNYVFSFIPNIPDPKNVNRSIPDPNHQLAVLVSNCDEVILNSGQQHLDLLAPHLSEVEPHVIHKFASREQCIISFSSEAIADKFLQKLKQRQYKGRTVATSQSAHLINVRLSKTAISHDCFTISHEIA